MALLFADSFDHYVTADIFKKWNNTYTGNSAPSISASAGRRSTSGVRWSAITTSNSSMAKSVSPSGSTAIAQFAYRCGNIGSLNTNVTGHDPTSTLSQANVLCGFRLSGTMQAWLRINAAGTISAYRSTTLLGTSSGGAHLQSGVFHYLEIKLVIHGSTGVITVKLDGVEILSTTPANTNGNTAALAWDEFFHRPMCSDTGFNIDIDDVILLDGSGSYNNDFIGDRAVSALFATSPAGNSSMSTASGGAVDRYTMIDEAAFDSDTTYNTLAAAADKDTYNYGACPVSGSDIAAVCPTSIVRKADGGACTIVPVARISGTDYDHATQKGVPSSYASVQHVWERSAVDGTTQWTTAVIDAAEFGLKKAV